MMFEVVSCNNGFVDEWVRSAVDIGAVGFL